LVRIGAIPLRRGVSEAQYHVNVTQYMRQRRSKGVDPKQKVHYEIWV
jgi:hypothetical protein